MRRIFLFGFLLIGGIVLLLQQVLAQGGIGITISPLVFEITGNPGEVIENQVKITNPSDASVGIKMTVEDIAPADEAGHVIVEPAETESYSVSKWVKTEPAEFTLEPKEGQWVKFIISIPANAEPGGHYGTVVAGGVVVAGGEVTGAAIAPRVGALVLLTVPGAMKESLTVKDFTAPPYSEYGPINFAIRFENTGTVHLKPRGLITITNWLGKKVADVPFPEKNVLPDAIRKIETSWDQKWLWAGKYTATLTGSYGISNTPFIPVVITFWAFPWKFGLAILIVIILLILIRKRLGAAFRVLIRGEGRS